MRGGGLTSQAGKVECERGLALSDLALWLLLLHLAESSVCCLWRSSQRTAWQGIEASDGQQTRGGARCLKGDC